VFSDVTSVFKVWKSCDFEFFKDRYPHCVIFACFLSCVLGVFNSPQWRLRHTGSSVLARVFNYKLSQNPSLLCIFMPPATSLSC